ncbi:acyclic terpene utilization AtuA family protein [Pseudonocardia endophytica]|uniref:Uncharacterized protein DUF1446 n=1 Tax=Pseudonocardia endophytica TaxID=401976 RepID=A0A4R1HUD7_PSEEN|nr:acyclic terpene utilization AtuA family protein [Pseudonocardia endophytica]TCK26307.1 uncharacterized protein DUF1446 [Pseudonocardia endophytica]
MTTRPVRVANCSGWLHDRVSGLRDALAGPVDVVTGDYLAEPTLRQLARERGRDPGLGYARSFLAQFRDAVDLVVAAGTKVVVDAGGLNPAGLADEVRKAGLDAGHRLSVAHVEGDDLLARLDALQADGEPLSHLDTGAPLRSWGLTPRTANAYLGAFGITAALNAGADVVICPRVTDASLTVGAAAWWHGWRPDDLDALAGAVVAGHVIECGPQATGGNFSGFTTLADPRRPGYPIAEIAADGSAVITKHDGTGGTVSTDTVTAQLVYEIQGPVYLNPDVAVHLDTVRLAQVGPDRVEVRGATGTPPPPTTKLALTAEGGFETSVSAYLTGLDVDAKYALLRDHIEDLAGSLPLTRVRLDRIGVPAEDPPDQWAAAQQVVITAQAPDRDAVGLSAFVQPVVSQILETYPGFYVSPVRAAQQIEAYWPAVVPVSAIEHAVVLEDGSRLVIPPAPLTEPFTGQPPAPEPCGTDPVGDTVRIPLGRVTHARSGDKGPNSNVGFWCDERTWPWLRSALTTDLLRRLHPDAGGLRIERHELPALRVVHFVLRGALDEGAGTNGRPDGAGKAVAEFLRARHVDVPVELVPAEYRAATR